jgi:uncharacterized protein YjaG (DUF416 family)
MNKIETNVVKPKISFFENEVENLILDFNQETILDNKIKDIEDYIKNNNGKGKTEEEKDELYKNAQELWKSYAISLKETKYNFFLNRNQYNFLTNLILTKLEYDVNTVFLAIELTNLLGDMKSAKFSSDTELISFPVNATEITYIYHLIANHKVKGLTKDAYTFSQVLIRIGDISKVFNYYDTAGKNLSTEIQDWVTLFDDAVTREVVEETITAEVLESN